MNALLCDGSHSRCDREVRKFRSFPGEARSVRVTVSTLKQMRLSRQSFPWQSRSHSRSEEPALRQADKSIGGGFQQEPVNALLCDRSHSRCDREVRKFRSFPGEARSVRVTVSTLKQMRLSRQSFPWQSRSHSRSEEPALRQADKSIGGGFQQEPVNALFRDGAHSHCVSGK